MGNKSKHIAIQINENGECVSIAKVVLINDKEFERLSNQYSNYNEKQIKQEKEFKEFVYENRQKIKRLEEKCVFLAKSIYDNFVDRGLIENDNDFQKAYFDFIFNDKPIDFEKAPNEYKLIYEKVVKTL